ncbi:MAG TPA: chromate transporter [Mobilitalea sp.]|nr:chromate transporter [Mobilitalea sp.]
MKRDIKLYWKLFTSTFLLSAFTFGGGYVIVPLMKKKFVDKLHWIEEEEMLNMIAIAQSSPGAIAVNSSIMIGYRIAGITGALIATLGTVMPPLIIITIISLFYQSFRDSVVVRALLKGMQAGVAAVIMDVVISMSGKIIKGKQIVAIFMMFAAFAATFIFDINVIYIILISGFIGAFTVIYREKHKKGGIGA